MLGASPELRWLILVAYLPIRRNRLSGTGTGLVPYWQAFSPTPSRNVRSFKPLLGFRGSSATRAAPELTDSLQFESNYPSTQSVGSAFPRRVRMHPAIRRDLTLLKDDLHFSAARWPLVGPRKEKLTIIVHAFARRSLNERASDNERAIGICDRGGVGSQWLLLGRKGLLHSASYRAAD
jgi:hypothetical protein